MKHHPLDTLDRYRFVIAALIVLACGGGCMMAFQPQHPVTLGQLGVDDHTRARVEGQADPRPTDPLPHVGLNGVLVVAEVVMVPPNHYYIDPHEHNASGAGVATGDPTSYPFYVLHPKTTPGTIDRLRGLDGITGVSILNPDNIPNNRGRWYSVVNGRDAMLQAARDAGGDLLLVYTASTDADATDVTLSIGAILTLGFGPTVVVSGEATLQAVLIDAHTGYVYAFAEAEGDSLGVSGAWTRESEKMDEADDAIEEAVSELIDRLEAAWPAMRGAYP